ncbi:hypothetical protein QF001_001647 [Paraburkholderia youngii]
MKPKMNSKTETQSRGKLLLKAILFVATIGAGTAAGAPNVGLDESLRSSADDQGAEVVRLGRRYMMPSRTLSDGAREPVSPPATEAPRTVYLPGAQTFLDAAFQPGEARNRYGAGSFASTALGSTASVPRGL